MAKLNKEAIARAIALFAPDEVVQRLADYVPVRHDYVDQPTFYAALDIWEKGKDARWYLLGMTGHAKARFLGDDASFHADDTGEGQTSKEIPVNDADLRLAEAAPKEYAAYHRARDELCAIAPGPLDLAEKYILLAESRLLPLASAQPKALLAYQVAVKTLTREAPVEFLAFNTARIAFMADDSAFHDGPEHRAWRSAAAKLRRRQPDVMAEYEAAAAQLKRRAPMDFFLWLTADDDSTTALRELYTAAPQQFNAYVAAGNRLAEAAPKEYQAAFAASARSPHRKPG